MDYRLQKNPLNNRLELIDFQEADSTPFFIDFLSGKLAYRYDRGISCREPLARAVGARPKRQVSVIDATAGLGRDAFLLACYGCQVTLIERATVLYELLADGLARAAQSERLATVVSRMSLICANSIDYLNNPPTEISHQVIYLDPMFPARHKSALVKKEMRMIRSLVGADEDANDLFKVAMHSGVGRVVVKRERSAPFLLHKIPSHQIIGKTTRYDIYLSQQCR